MYVLSREYSVDEYHSAFSPIACSQSKEKLEKLIEILKREKEDFLELVEKRKIEKCVPTINIIECQEIYNGMLHLPKYFSHYLGILDFFNFDIIEIELYI